jgi:hypothetical protein
MPSLKDLQHLLIAQNQDRMLRMQVADMLKRPITDANEQVINLHKKLKPLSLPFLCQFAHLFDPDFDVPSSTDAAYTEW